MRRSPHASRLIPLAILLGFASLVTASAQTPDPSKSSIKWPDSPRAPLAYSTREIPFDGVNITIGLISGDGISWENKFFQSWIVAKDPAGQSITFRSKTWQDLKLSIAVFSPTEFLPDISDAVWAGYLAGLQRSHDNKCDILDQFSATVDGSPWVPVLGAKTRSITFRYPVGESEDRFNAETQLFAFCKDRLVVFVLSGPEKEVMAATPAFYSLIRSVRDQTPPRK
jgi:hypothetical protein